VRQYWSRQNHSGWDYGRTLALAAFPGVGRRPPLFGRASEDTLLDRIALRGRSYESGGVDRDYLTALNRSYDRFFAEYQIGPRLEINMNDFDIALRPSDTEKVLRLIAEATGYNPELVLF
jgi:deoxyadenosine/deoxycytidine kinase